ncbi:MAG: hypothetical protein GY854_32785 [Deltaproteobacteria bacterium]|nr:hypothetical protein [Deltaproteobacteria bacterium]
MTLANGKYEMDSITIAKSLKPQFLLVFFLLLGPIFLPSSSSASEQVNKNQRVLVINSYHPGYSWSDDIMRGIQDSLGKKEGVELIIEHLDTKRHFGQAHFQQMEALFRHKYSSSDIDLVITSDDNALDFSLRIRESLFPNVPLVFCGIDHLKPNRISRPESVYGIEEADGTSSTIELILSIHPDLELITFVADETSTGRLMVDKAKKLAPTYQKRVRFDYIVGAPVENLQSTLRKLPKKSAVFYLSYIRDPNNRVFSIESSMRLVLEQA